MSFMKSSKPKKTAYLSMKVSETLKKRVEEMAQKEHRSLADQMTYLVEKGLSALEAAPATGTSNG